MKNSLQVPIKKKTDAFSSWYGKDDIKIRVIAKNNPRYEIYIHIYQYQIYEKMKRKMQFTVLFYSFISHLILYE